MQSLSEDNHQELRDFIFKNIDKSLFIYGNLESNNKIVRFKKVDNYIIGMYIIVMNKYITYLFANNISPVYIEEIINDSLNYTFLEGTVAGVDKNILLNYFNIKNEEDLTEIANLKLTYDNSFELFDNIELLNLEDNNLLNSYLKEFNNVESFQSQSLETIMSNAHNSKIYIYLIDRSIVGAATLSAISTKTGVVTGVFVNKNYQRQKIATKLLNHLLKDNSDIDRNISIFFNNPNAKNLYLKLGFEINNEMCILLRKDC